MVLVANDASRVHDDASERIWRGRKTLSLCSIEAESDLQDHGHEICKRVCNGRGSEEKHRKEPDFRISRSFEVCTKAECGDPGIATISIHFGHNEFRFLGREKTFVGLCIIWKSNP